MYVLGYIPKDNRLYLGDKELNIVSFSILLSVLEYQTAVMRKDFDTADKVRTDVSRSYALASKSPYLWPSNVDFSVYLLYC